VHKIYLDSQDKFHIFFQSIFSIKLAFLWKYFGSKWKKQTKNRKLVSQKHTSKNQWLFMLSVELNFHLTFWIYLRSNICPFSAKKRYWFYCYKGMFLNLEAAIEKHKNKKVNKEIFEVSAWFWIMIHPPPQEKEKEEAKEIK